MRSGVRNRPSRSGSSPRRTSSSRSNSCVVADPSADVSYALFTLAPLFRNSPSSLTQATSFADFPASRIFERIEQSLFYADSFDLRVAKPFLHQVVESHAHIFRGGHRRLELRQRIQVLVVQAFQYVVLHKGVQVGQIADHPCLSIHRTSHGNLQRIVVAMAVRIIALAVHSLVFLRRHGIAMQAVRSGKPVAPCQISFHFFTTATASTSMSHSGRTNGLTKTKVLTGGLLILTNLSRTSRTTEI